MSAHDGFFGHATDGKWTASTAECARVDVDMDTDMDMHSAAVDMLLGDGRAWHDR
jgi:hypothetical protein